MGHRRIAVLTALALVFHQAYSFTSTRSTYSSSTRLFVFDFFKERSEEGLAQLSNLGDLAKRGQLSQGLANAAEYTKITNKKFADGLARSRSRLLENLEAVLTGETPEEFLEDLEDVLLQADIGTTAAEEVIEEVKSLREDSTKFLSKQDLKSILRGKLLEALETDMPRNIRFSEQDSSFPTVLFIMGANGQGKTTTIGKLANRLRVEGEQKVLMAACDTFRAGAVDQLQTWADRAEVDMVGPTETAKAPAAVLYNALDVAVEGSYDTLLVDTSGRLSNNNALTEELVKMKRVIQKKFSVESDDEDKPLLNMNVPHETLLVIDAAQGRMALDSAKAWDESLGLSGLILTKLDGSARGGSVVAVTRDLGLPVKLIGVGEGIDDLRDFEPESFVDGLLGIGVKSANEGAMLAARLAEMRQERDERAKLKPKTPQASTVAAPPPDLAELVEASSAPAGRSNNKKKKKKKKRK